MFLAFAMLTWHTMAVLSSWDTRADWRMLCELTLPRNQMNDIIPGC